MNEKSIVLADERSARFKMEYRRTKGRRNTKMRWSGREELSLDIEADEWHEVATLHQGDTLTVFINGKEVAPLRRDLITRRKSFRLRGAGRPSWMTSISGSEAG